MRTYRSTADANFNSTASQPPPSPPPKSSFRPSVAIAVGIAATLFSLTFLLLLYSNRCRRRRLLLLSPHSSSYQPNYPSSPRRHSGLHRGIVSALPLFRFSSLHKRPSLDCAVCLSPFLPADLLRLLPRCRHAFHLDCVDTWLDSHSTCPLCRCRVHPDDVFLLSDDDPPPPASHNCGFLRPARISGRHSSAGERSTTQPPPPAKRNSVDDGLLSAAPAPPRKDRLLPTSEAAEKIAGKRFEHCIVVSGGIGDVGRGGERWSDLLPSDLLFLRSEMLLPPRCESEITAVARRPHAEEERLALRRLLASAASRWLRAGDDGRNSTDPATGITR